jgi:hypothetical protein
LVLSQLLNSAELAAHRGYLHVIRCSCEADGGAAAMVVQGFTVPDAIKWTRIISEDSDYRLLFAQYVSFNHTPCHTRRRAHYAPTCETNPLERVSELVEREVNGERVNTTVLTILRSGWFGVVSTALGGDRGAMGHKRCTGHRVEAHPARRPRGVQGKHAVVLEVPGREQVHAGPVPVHSAVPGQRRQPRPERCGPYPEQSSVTLQRERGERERGSRSR